MSEKMLELKDLHKTYLTGKKGGVRYEALKGISFDAYEGDFIAIMGESGSGKTMSALAIAGLLSRHDMEKSGKIIFEGINLLECERKVLRKLQGYEISMIFQEPLNSLNPIIKVGKQVEESLLIHTTIEKAERKERAIQALRDVELDNPEAVYNSYPHELSGGMRQRAMIAAAMISQPRLLIADEPTTALDVTIQAQIVELLKKINRERGTAILFISHDPSWSCILYVYLAGVLNSSFRLIPLNCHWPFTFLISTAS